MMFKLKKIQTTLKSRVVSWGEFLFCHRALYTGLSICHGLGCILTEKPELYGPMAFFYVILAYRG